MSDDRLRWFEKRFRETGAIEDEVDWLQERLRVGDLDLDRLLLASLCDHVPSQIVNEGSSFDGVVTFHVKSPRFWLSEVLYAFEYAETDFHHHIFLRLGLVATYAAFQSEVPVTYRADFQSTLLLALRLLLEEDDFASSANQIIEAQRKLIDKHWSLDLGIPPDGVSISIVMEAMLGVYCFLSGKHHRSRGNIRKANKHFEEMRRHCKIAYQDAIRLNVEGDSNQVLLAVVDHLLQFALEDDPIVNLIAELEATSTHD